MGGIGKTTLAKSVYANPLTLEYFDFRGWATISQEYNSKQILVQVLVCLNIIGSTESFGQMSEQELGDKLYKRLFGRRYLIVMDDVWCIELSDSDGVLKMGFLNEDESWNLFCKCVFREEDYCPPELEETGKEIAKSCKGLPLSITVIGGLLSRHKRLREYWDYKELPVHLKPCFLYMGVFPEDHAIHVATLIRLWVAEGFLKPIGGKSLEMAAEKYLKDLVDRNLILVHKFESTGKVKYCKVHDLLRDLCLKEAEKHKFLCFNMPRDLKSPNGVESQRRIGFQQCTSDDELRGELTDTLQSAKFCSVICDIKDGIRGLPFLNIMWLRVLMASDIVLGHPNNYSPETNFQLVNLRYLEVSSHQIPAILSSIHHLWNLQTLEVVHAKLGWDDYKLNIWKMTQLRHVNFDGLNLPDTPSMDDDDGASYCLNNLCWLRKLESLCCSFYSIKKGPTRRELAQRLVFPHLLKKLTLRCSNLQWEEMGTKIGSLPHLQVLELDDDAFIEAEWETSEGQFQSLKYLRIHDCKDLEYWRSESTHLPCLEYLDLWKLEKLKEIPLEIGEISSLVYIELQGCSDSAIISDKKCLNSYNNPSTKLEKEIEKK
ncbi:putative late blight resistance protein homolog r1b-14 [Phtheirospermum japonicum]|uniref:Putative late blight resistance protein homolog r1b-14 n=1 Tax=Phtheirospermum japonicum TaxID=374723 RepID=A0A830CXG6_9LAMI|nr:putative late blight resistance protein homolog r1b-14 [Phtheirospermum japonicum]